MPSSYWQAQTAPLNQGIGNLSAGLSRMPMIQAQGRMMAQRGQLYGQQAQEAGARTGLITAQTENEGAKTEHEQALTGQIAKSISLVNTIQQQGPAARKAMLEGRQDDPSIDAVTGAAAALTGANKGDVWKSFAGSIAVPRAAAGDVQGAADVENPVSVANNAATNARMAAAPRVVPSGSTLMSTSGQPLGAGGYSLNPGQTRFAPQGNLAAGLGTPPAPGESPDATGADTVLAPADQTPAATPTALSAVLQNPIAKGAPLPPKSSAAQTAKAQFVKDALLEQAKGTLGTNTVGSLEDQYDQATAPQANAAAPAPAPTPPPMDVSWLQSAPNPGRVATFEGKYGQGSAAQYLKKSK